MSNHETTEQGSFDDNSLETLWRTQEVFNLDIEEIKKSAIHHRRKQRRYIFIDVLSITPLFLFFFIDLDLTPFLKTLLWVNLLASTVVVVYLISLRWKAAFSQCKSTQEYTELTLKQLKNNAHIARINKHCGWLAIVIAISCVFMHGMLQDYSPEKILYKVGLVFVFTALLLIPWTIWAHKRQSRFTKEAEQFQNLVSME